MRCYIPRKYITLRSYPGSFYSFLIVNVLPLGHTLVVLKGSGRISEIVCYAVENSIEVEKMENG